MGYFYIQFLAQKLSQILNKIWFTAQKLQEKARQVKKISTEGKLVFTLHLSPFFSFLIYLYQLNLYPEI